MSTDFYPTLMKMAGLPLLSSQYLDGESMVPLLKEEGQRQSRCLFWHYPHYGNQVEALALPYAAESIN